MPNEASERAMHQIDVEVVDDEVVETVHGGCEYRYPDSGHECVGDGWHSVTVSYVGKETTMLLCALHANLQHQLEDVDE